MKIVKESINFKKGGNPVDDMNLGNPLNKPPGIILQILAELFGDTVIIYELSGRIILNRTLPMSGNDWSTLKKKLKEDIDPDFKWPMRYTQSVFDGGQVFKEVNYTQILEDTYGRGWYFDDADLVQGDKTIVHVSKGMTFKEMMEKLQASPNLITK